MVLVKNRNDVALTYYSLNIYPENIGMAMDKPKIKNLLSGKFVAYATEASGKQPQKLHILFENKINRNSNHRELTAIKKAVHSSLLQTNAEFRKLYSSLGEKIMPQIRLLPFNSAKILKFQALGLLFQNGKKPRLLNGNKE